MKAEAGVQAAFLRSSVSLFGREGRTDERRGNVKRNGNGEGAQRGRLSAGGGGSGPGWCAAARRSAHPRAPPSHPLL